MLQYQSAAPQRLIFVAGQEAANGRVPDVEASPEAAAMVRPLMPRRSSNGSVVPAIILDRTAEWHCRCATVCVVTADAGCCLMTQTAVRYPRALSHRVLPERCWQGDREADACRASWLPGRDRVTAKGATTLSSFTLRSRSSVARLICMLRPASRSATKPASAELRSSHSAAYPLSQPSPAHPLLADSDYENGYQPASTWSWPCTEQALCDAAVGADGASEVWGGVLALESWTRGLVAQGDNRAQLNGMDPMSRPSHMHAAHHA